MPIFLLIYQGICIAVGMKIARRLKKRDPELTLATAGRRTPYLYGTIAILTLFFAASFIVFFFDGIEQRLPLPAQRDSKLAPTIAAVLLFGGLSGFMLKLALLEAHPLRSRYRIRIVLGNILLGVLVAAQHMPVAPLLTNLEKDGVILQSSGFSCGPACVANVARSFEIPLSEKKASQLLGTVLSGTTFGQMRYALDRLGIVYQTLDKTKAIGQIAPPAILAVDHPIAGPERHLIVYLEAKNGGYQMIDPLSGPEIWTAQKLAAVWHGNGIECSRLKDMNENESARPAR